MMDLPTLLKESFFQEIFNKNISPIIVLDAQYSILALNHLASRIYPFPNPVEKVNFNEWCRSNNVVTLFPDCLEFLKKYGKYQRELHYDNKYVLWTVIPFHNQEAISCFVLVGHDNTRERLLGHELKGIVQKEKKTKEQLVNIAKQVTGHNVAHANVVEITHLIYYYLDNIIAQLPGSAYWKDKNLVYLGCNSYCASLIGFKSRSEIIGKDDYDIARLVGYPEGVADSFRRDDELVLKSGKGLFNIEEPIFTSSSGEEIHQLTTRVPLIDDHKNIIGVLGISIDVAARERAAALELENSLQKAKLAEQEEFKKLANQMVHDIRSPLASLLMILKACEKDIPELARVTLREAAIGISDIANSMLNKYKKEGVYTNSQAEERQPILVSLVLLQLINDKKYEYSHAPVNFEIDFSEGNSFGFIMSEPTTFRRMISNLINNSVDACKGKEGVIALKLKATKDEIKITIQDNDKGMPQDVINKIMCGTTITANKENGHGIGLVQVREALQQNSGKFSINSEVGIGTKLALTFPAIEPPNWIAKQIELNRGDTVVILDDDSSIHCAWEVRLKNYVDDISIQHFTSGRTAINFINSFLAKDEILLLTDFELLAQELNGLHVIEQTNVKRSILVTSHFSNKLVRDLTTRTNTKILPKMLSSEVPIKINRGKEPMQKSSKQVDVVLIDDEPLLIEALASILENRNQVVNKYYNPAKFLENLAQYTKETKICMDNSFGDQMTGLELAKLLHDAGYTKLYLFSGKDFEKGEIPSYLTVVRKTDTEVIYDLLGC